MTPGSGTLREREQQLTEQLFFSSSVQHRVRGFQ